MVDAIETQGFTFEILRPASPGEYTEVVGVTNFTGLDGQANEIDVTHLKSDAKEYLMGLQDFGGFNIDVNHLPADPGQQLLRAAKASRDVQTFRATLSDGSTISFQAYVLSNPISGGVDSKVEGRFNLRTTGDVTFS